MIPVDTTDNDKTPDEDIDSRPSKSQKKRDMLALQDMGEALVAMSAERLAKIDMPETLLDAIRAAQRITKHEARRRQMQYIGRLMRDTETVPIQAALDIVAGVSAAENARLHRLERLRTLLLENESSALDEITAAHPGADLQQLRQLRRNALKEQQQNKPPRAFREIFRILRELDGEANQ